MEYKWLDKPPENYESVINKVRNLDSFEQTSLLSYIMGYHSRYKEFVDAVENWLTRREEFNKKLEQKAKENELRQE